MLLAIQKQTPQQEWRETHVPSQAAPKPVKGMVTQTSRTPHWWTKPQGSTPNDCPKSQQQELHLHEACEDATHSDVVSSEEIEHRDRPHPCQTVTQLKETCLHTFGLESSLRLEQKKISDILQHQEVWPLTRSHVHKMVHDQRSVWNHANPAQRIHCFSRVEYWFTEVEYIDSWELNTPSSGVTYFEVRECITSIQGSTLVR